MSGHPALRIDLGCGAKKQPGFTGLDRYALGGVDIVADLNRTLPFRDDSIDLLLASHSLEHVETLLDTISEIYRICKHGAQLCIVAPYSEQKLNWANPYHKWVFNEHTPRFWTDHPDTPVDPREFHHPHAYQWGLSRTDNSNPEIDIRLVRMECFYFPRYAGLPPCEQRRLRQERTDVCEQIMYHLIVWKGGAQDEARPYDDYVARFQPYEPEYITQLRKQRQEVSPQESAQHSTFLDGADQLRSHAVSLTAEITRLHQHYAAQTEALAQVRAELSETSTYNRILRDEAVRVERDLEFARAELRRESAAAAALQEEASSLARQNRELTANLHVSDVLRAKLALTRAELETTTTLLGLQRQREEGLIGEVAAARREAESGAQGAAAAFAETERWKALWNSAKQSLSAVAAETHLPQFAAAVRAGGYIIGRDSQIQGLPKGLIPLREYCDRLFGTARACIAIGGDLTEVPYREYVIPFAVDRLTAVVFAIRPLVTDSAGVVGVEIVSHHSEILAHVRRELTAIQRDGVTEFRLPESLSGLEKNWLLRVFVRDVATPVSVYELVRGGLFRGNTQTYPLITLS